MGTARRWSQQPSPLAAPPASVDSPPPEETVRIAAPVGRDAALTRDLLSEAGFRCAVSETPQALERDLERPTGALVLTEEAVASPGLAVTRAALDRQPAWSEMPVVLFVSGHRPQAQTLRALDAFGPSASVTLLERPIGPPTLVSVVGAALRARRRQYEARDLLAQLQDLNRTLEERVVARTEEVRRLASALTLPEQRERERIAEVLHDHLQQLLFGVQMKLAVLGGAPEAERGAVAAEADALLAEAMEATRTLTAELHPPVLLDDGLTVAVEWLAQHYGERYGLDVAVEADGPARLGRREVVILLTQCVRELLFNVAKHAGTGEARIEIASADGLRLAVIDEGEGFDTATVGRRLGGHGLRTLQDRLALLGGGLEIDSVEGRGTRATIRLPAEAASGAG